MGIFKKRNNKNRFNDDLPCPELSGDGRNLLNDFYKEKTDNEKSKEQTVEQQEKKDNLDLDLCYFLGKTPNGLKQEFYQFQVDELMAKIGLSLLDGEKDKKTLIDKVEECKEYGSKEVLFTPFYLPIIKQVVKKTSAKTLKLITATDYPLGQSGIKSKVNSVKESIKQGSNKVGISLTCSAVDFSLLGEEKRKTEKAIKASKGQGGVIVEGIYDHQSIIKTLKAIDGIKFSRIYIKLEKSDFISPLELVSKIKQACPKKSLCIISNAKTISDLSVLTSGQCDLIFTPYANVIGQSLYKTFNLTPKNTLQT
ncbi:MAG: hypothetical protein II988_01605 [Clostridia bacterium]|nr:hypothetical protein [Clostridia bacterium]